MTEGFTPGPRHKVFGISDDLLNTTRNILMGMKPEAEEPEEEVEAVEDQQALAENEGRFVKRTNTDYDSLGHPIKPLPIPKKKKKPTDSGIVVPKMDKNEALSHNCANHVKSEQWGDGQCVPGMHTLEETSEGEGVVTHYDVLFDHGIEEDVSVEDLEIVSEKYHSHKKSMKEDDDDDDDNGDDKPKKKSKKSKKLDKVDPDELEGSHDERDDEDIDNDGDEDDSDKYLHKRRKAIHKATKKESVQ
jgi:hypothetical protein